LFASAASVLFVSCSVSSAVSLVQCCYFRVASFSVLSKFRVQRSVQTYVDISGGDRCEMSAMSFSVSEAE
jgi:hypothetical protein